jgi:hypothetical protein
MANDFGALTDHFSIATTDLILIDSSKTPVAESVAEALDENGDLAARTLYGNDGGTISDASCTYALVSGTLNLNTLSVGELETGVVVTGIDAATTNGDWPKITVSGKLGTAAFQAPTGKTATAALPSLTITGGKFAQVMSFTVGSGCKLTSCSFSVGADIAQVDDGLGEPAAYAASFNKPPEISAEFVRITAQPSWTVASPLEETQAPSTVEPHAAYHTSSAKGIMAVLTRGTAA